MIKKRYLGIIILSIFIIILININYINLIKEYIGKNHLGESVKIDNAGFSLTEGFKYKVEYEDENLLYIAEARVRGLSELDFFELYNVPKYDKLIKMIDLIEISEVDGYCSSNGEGDYDISYKVDMLFPIGYDKEKISRVYDIYYFIAFKGINSEGVFSEKDAEFQLISEECELGEKDNKFTMVADIYYRLEDKNLKEAFINQKNEAVIFIKSGNSVLRKIKK